MVSHYLVLPIHCVPITIIMGLRHLPLLMEGQVMSSLSVHMCSIFNRIFRRIGIMQYTLDLETISFRLLRQIQPQITFPWSPGRQGIQMVTKLMDVLGLRTILSTLANSIVHSIGHILVITLRVYHSY